jgi:hypothetical protein
MGIIYLSTADTQCGRSVGRPEGIRSGRLLIHLFRKVSNPVSCRVASLHVLQEIGYYRADCEESICFQRMDLVCRDSLRVRSPRAKLLEAMFPRDSRRCLGTSRLPVLRNLRSSRLRHQGVRVRICDQRLKSSFYSATVVKYIIPENIPLAPLIQCGAKTTNLRSHCITSWIGIHKFFEEPEVLRLLFRIRRLNCVSLDLRPDRRVRFQHLVKVLNTVLT